MLAFVAALSVASSGRIGKATELAGPNHPKLDECQMMIGFLATLHVAIRQVILYHVYFVF